MGSSVVALFVLLVAPSRGAAIIDVGDLFGGTSSSFANGISADGKTVVGSANTPADPIAFRWTISGGIQSIGDLPGGSTRSSAYAVSSDGSVAVGEGNITSSLPASVPQQAFRWSQANGMDGLGFMTSAQPF